MSFEKASRMKVRFESPRGLLTVEDLWDLPLLSGGANLDDIAKSVHRKIKKDSEESFVIEQDEPDEELLVMFDVVKHVIKVRLAEKKAAESAELNGQKKQQILAIIADKESEKLKESSIDDLRVLIADL